MQQMTTIVEGLLAKKKRGAAINCGSSFLSYKRIVQLNSSVSAPD